MAEDTEILAGSSVLMEGVMTKATAVDAITPKKGRYWSRV